MNSKWGPLFALAALVLAGCARRAGPPPIASDAECARCSMSTGNARFACERLEKDRWLVYDSIECLWHDAPHAAAATVWLPDYDQRALHRADSLWIVKGELATPMGGGFAAFLERAAADTVAGASHGLVMRWSELAATGGRP